ncbi:MAG: DUF2585 domain-containing protein [Hyphomicrobiales bacterium]
MPDSTYHPRIAWPWAAAAAAITATTAAILLWMGRVPFCRCGKITLWSNEVYSEESSQQFADWYTPSHIVHGFVFYFLLWLVARRLPQGARFVIAVLIECGWEMLENSDAVIERYRSVTISLNYFGDSVFNSVGDILAMMTGYLLAMTLPVAASVAIVVFLEVFCAWMIRDNLTLNIIMLTHPVEAIRQWQLEIAPKDLKLTP